MNRPAELTQNSEGDDEGIRITPDALDEYRYTHAFKGPSCLCAYLDASSFTEAKIGLVQTLGLGENPAACLGQYAAVCAKQRCGYFGT